MKKLFLLIPLLLFVFINTIGQNNLPAVYEITTDTTLHTTLPDRFWQMLEDKEGKLSFEEVSKSPIAEKFHYNAAISPQYDRSIHGYWFRYVLKNTMDHVAKICLGDNFNKRSDQSEFYLITGNGEVTHQVNGLLTPWSKLNGLKEYLLIPIELKPGEQIAVYRRVFTSYTWPWGSWDNIWVGFNSTEKAMQKIYTIAGTDYLNAIHNSFIFGMLAFASLFIFFFFLIIKEKVYLYFSLYLLDLGIGRFNTNNEMYDTFFREFPLLYLYISSFIWFFSIFFLVHFIRHLLNTKLYLPRWDKFLIGLNFLYALTYLLDRILTFSGSYNSAINSVIDYEIWLLALSVPATFLLSLKWFKTNKVLTWVILPLQSIWSICVVFVMSYSRFGNPVQVNWLRANWLLFETILLSCLVIAFSWILLQRFVDLKKQIVQKELEKEIERSKLIEKQKIELEEQVTKRTAELKQSLDNLKATQSQLIQSEKMASLGELTAGIAHEIQNPLNFVNNFSEVNKELLEEMKEEIDKGNLAEVKIIANDVIVNEQKINHHGKRADAIVKGMLQHSRNSSGVKEPTDINALADEYFRLAYHGLRAKDKSFNAIMKTDFDKNLCNINIIPQDIGRVILNLITNAFYVVDEKTKSGIENYEPTVSVSTKKDNGNVEIRVKDNGNGIPKKVIDKIFQPFFTTKPTGQGTGLGLSLSYDIVKAHGGELKVETKEGEGSEFIIHLPIKTN